MLRITTVALSLIVAVLLGGAAMAAGGEGGGGLHAGQIVAMVIGIALAAILLALSAAYILPKPPKF
ncbi:MAG: hypothetical protein F4Y69_06705 [Chloroflexi bacterium]|nr:hypothetical protein [Chloroflexota bacterium]MYB21571.1 hypothetical protein [Chloroflexota bacterium]MYF23233.1 hypothetical protein [Chloroflexota bacterium]MYF81593.1 hypothetical protein [Chloroflexota bacterium]MYI03612.1 hypothetical protein [Chloroflexota bacterium]